MYEKFQNAQSGYYTNMGKYNAVFEWFSARVALCKSTSSLHVLPWSLHF